MIDILCTLGPSSLNTKTIARLNELDVSLFRINLSHTSVTELAGIIDFVREHSFVPICVDTEGAQVRTGTFIGGAVELLENSFVTVPKVYVNGTASTFNFYPRGVVDQFHINDFVSIDFNAVLTQVIDSNENGAILRVVSGGLIGSNKAVTVNRAIDMPALTEKDKQAIAIASQKEVRHFALSFAACSPDVDTLRGLSGDNSFIISKIESRRGLSNLKEIANASDAILLDRGDLSREIPIARIPSTQKKIIKEVSRAGRKCYVATNLLESMVTRQEPTRAEVNDVYNTMLDGASGLVLAAETAVGKYPVECVRMISKLIEEFNIDKHEGDPFFSPPLQSHLIEPHGGELVARRADTSDFENLDNYKFLGVNNDILSDCESICTGVYSPLSGFMDKETIESVLRENSLPDGTVWTMPITLPITEALARSLVVGERIVLGSEQTRNKHVVMDLTSIFRIDTEEVSMLWFGTQSVNHPGVKRMLSLGNWLLSGSIKLLRPLTHELTSCNLTPEQCRFIFSQKGWRHVVGFHTRNVAHRAHEFIQLQALEMTHADGLFINPALGSKKSGDFLSGPIMKSYQLLIESGTYPANKVVLGSFSTYSRYCGPREAVFTAICRKNMGCNYFIVGRDHTGVGDYYAPHAAQVIFDQIGDIGIAPVFFDTVGFDVGTGRYTTDNTKQLKNISASQFRDAISARQPVPDWLVRPVIQEMLLSEVDDGRPIFYG